MFKRYSNKLAAEGNVLSVLDKPIMVYGSESYVACDRQKPMCVRRSQPLAAEASIAASRNTCSPRKSGYTPATLGTAPSCSQVGHASNPSVSGASPALGST
jgi:hypothetical protein